MISPYVIPGIILSIDEIVADTFNVYVEDLKSRSRIRELVEARHFAMWFRVLNTKDGPSRIGRLYDRDHASVNHACKTVTNLLHTDKTFKKKAELTIRKLKEAGYGKN